MSRLASALDNEVHICVQKFLNDGIQPNPTALYNAIQKSNSSLKRKPKKLILGSIERVLEFMDITGHESDDSQARLEEPISQHATTAEAMNRSLRQNLGSRPMENGQSSQVENLDDSSRKRRGRDGEPVPKRSKIEKSTSAVPPTDISLLDIGGMDPIIRRLENLLITPLMDPLGDVEMGVKPPNGILFHGPPGCGKTMLSRAFAADMGIPFVEILGPSIVSGMSGESERAIRDKFEEAKNQAPCLIFMDEIDAIAPKRDSSQSGMEKRIVAQLLVCMDELQRGEEGKPVIVLATTNRPDSIDPALRRGGRFDTEINIPVPNAQVRESILRTQMRNTKLEADVDFAALAKMTAGFVGSDLHDLVSKAGFWQREKYNEARKEQMMIENGLNGSHGMSAVQSAHLLMQRLRRKDMPDPPGFENRAIGMSAFLAVLPSITPSSKREGFATIPNVSWADVGALQAVREELQASIVKPIKHPEIYSAFGVSAPTGVLLWGPPGCGKTLLAKAVAAESKANFISVKGPELLNKFVGESEAAVRRVFMRARSSVPCVIFFDELDALVPRRDDSGSEASARVVNTLLTELDGLDDREGIFIVAATNRPDMIDEAMLRPGRLAKPLFVDLPKENERAEILSTMLRGKPVEGLDDILTVVKKCDGYSGADIGHMVAEAMQRAIQLERTVFRKEDFDFAAEKVHGSVKDAERYRRLRGRFGK